MFNSTTVASNDKKGPETRVWPPYASLSRLVADGKAVHQHTQCDHCLVVRITYSGRNRLCQWSDSNAFFVLTYIVEVAASFNYS